MPKEKPRFWLTPSKHVRDLPPTAVDEQATTPPPALAIIIDSHFDPSLPENREVLSRVRDLWSLERWFKAHIRRYSTSFVPPPPTIRLPPFEMQEAFAPMDDDAKGESDRDKAASQIFAEPQSTLLPPLDHSTVPYSAASVQSDTGDFAEPEEPRTRRSAPPFNAVNSLNSKPRKRKSSEMLPAESIETPRRRRRSTLASMTIIATLLSSEQKVTLQNMCHLLNQEVESPLSRTAASPGPRRQYNVKIVDKWNDEVTHVVTNGELEHAPSRSAKMCQGLIAGRFVVTFDWVRDCIHRHAIVEEQTFLIKNFAKQHDDARFAKLVSTAASRALNQPTRLFANMRFLLLDSISSNKTRTEMTAVIQVGDGKVIDSLPDRLRVQRTLQQFIDSRAPPYYVLLRSSEESEVDEDLHERCTQHNVPIAPLDWLLDCCSSLTLLPVS